MNKPVYETGHQMGQIHPVIIAMMLAFFPLIGVALLGLGVFVSYHGIVMDGYPVLFVFFVAFIPISVIAALLILWGYALIVQGLTKYRFEKEGLIVKYPLREPRLISWDSFQQVCVCYAFETANGRAPRPNTIILCVKKGEKKNSVGQWKTNNLFRFRTLFHMDYQPEVLEGLKERCPHEIVDLRDSPNID